MFVVVLFYYIIPDKLDFWGGMFGIVIFGALETSIFSIKKGRMEMHSRVDFKIPGIFEFIMEYVTPASMLIILGVWTLQDAI